MEDGRRFARTARGQGRAAHRARQRLTGSKDTCEESVPEERNAGGRR